MLDGNGSSGLLVFGQIRKTEPTLESTLGLLKLYGGWRDIDHDS